VASGRSSSRRSWEEGWRGPRSWVVLEGAAATGGTSFFLESSRELELSSSPNRLCSSCSSTKICMFEPALARSSSSELELARLVSITMLRTIVRSRLRMLGRVAPHYNPTCQSVTSKLLKISHPAYIGYFHTTVLHYNNCALTYVVRVSEA
jgi:hypothetical protein